MLQLNKILNNEYSFSKVRSFIEKCNDAYYNKGHPLLTDEEYDQILKWYEKNSGDIMPIGSPISPGKKEVSIFHTFENLTGGLTKANDMEEFEKEFFERLPGIRNKDKINILCSLKYDGNSVAITYKNGKVATALTRGRDGKGACLKYLFGDHKIKLKEHIGIQYEIMMTYKSFDKLNSKLEEKDRYINPRSAVTGITSDLEGDKYKKYLRLVPIKVMIEGREDLSRTKELRLIENELFYDDDSFVKKMRISQSKEDFSGNYQDCINFIKQYYERYSLERYDLNYMVDGIVIEVINKSFKKLGYVQNRPKWIIALKFPYQEKESVVEKFEFDVGYSGRITPCVKFTPVTFNGAVQSRVSIANYKRFNELQLGVGSKVIIQYRNEVLSYLVKKECKSNKKIEPYPFITKCEICNSPVWINENKTFAYCRNEECPAVLRGKIVKYIKSLDIIGIDESIIDVLLKEKLLNSIVDLYSLKTESIAKLEGFGKKSAENIVNSIHKKVPMDYEILDGVGIEGIGSTFAREVLKVYELEDLVNNVDKYESNILQLEGFKNKRYELLKEGITSNKKILLKIINKVKFTSTKATSVKLEGNEMLKFVITGDTVVFKDRAELTNYITAKGHKVIGSISKNTSYLITNDTTSGTVKNQKAKSLGVPVIDEVKLKEILG